MPFENVTRDGRFFWLTEASAVLLTDDLNALGAGAITRTERQQAFERLQVPPAAVLTDATVIRIGQLVGASQVVVGSLQMEDDALVVRARSIALDTGRVQADVTERGPLPELFATFERIARRMAPPSATSSADIERQHPPVTVFEAFIKGLLAETPATAVSYLRAALAGQPSFDRARLALWDVYAEQGDHASALAAVASVTDDSPWFRRARFLAGLSQLNLKKYDDAFATFKALADADPSPALLNNLGVVQLRRGGTPQGGQPAYFFNKAADADPDDEDFLFNLGYAYWLDRDAHGGHLLAARSRAAQPRRRRRALRARGGARRRQQRRRSDARARAGAPPLGEIRAEQAPGRRRRAEGARARQAARWSCRTRGRSARGSRAASSAAARSSRASISSARSGCFSRKTIATRSSKLNHAIYLSPYLADAHLLLGRSLLRTGRCTRRSTRSRSRSGAPKPPRRTRRSARRTGRPRMRMRRARKRSARSRSIRRRRRRSSCWRGSTAANVLKSRWLWHNRFRTKAFTKSN